MSAYLNPARLTAPFLAPAPAAPGPAPALAAPMGRRELDKKMAFASFAGASHGLKLCNLDSNAISKTVALAKQVIDTISHLQRLRSIFGTLPKCSERDPSIEQGLRSIGIECSSLQGGAYRYITNCSSVAEINRVFLAEMHDNPDDYTINSRCTYFAKPGDKVYAEIGPTRELADHMVATSIMPQGVVFDSWDDKPVSVGYSSYFARIGFIFQRLIEVANKNGFEGDSLNKIAKDVTDIEDDLKASSAVVASRAIFETWKREKSDGNTFLELFQRTNNIGKFLSSDLSVWTKNTFDHRQKALVRVLQSESESKQRIFILGGKRHFIQDTESDDQIDDTLNKCLIASKGVGYLILYPRRDLTDPETAQEELETSREDLQDFRALPPVCSSFAAIKLSLKMMKECEAIAESRA